ncbi:MAG: uroporphyrinogen-III synthase [Aulosira sp. ZfuVER01]|nr:uroporphyrinogen-III synthase [Aulosira sp. ZfuVER01]MDZ7998302.1 uroporphyrinogen-III synthase [Aulosira sp. DedVER01a]MDZ8050079.1 uroporphyrinogen-III synthase [Aulosira sp. ZfuCHP01]
MLTLSNQLPLYGKRILVTAPRTYASRLSEEIIIKGGLPLLMPTIETTLLTDYAELDIVLKQINKFDWIAFTSRNGITAFFQRLNVLGIPTSALENCQLCAIGKDAELLLSLCGRVNLIPKESSPAGIVAELSQIPDISQKKVLVPVPLVVGIPEPNVVPDFIAGLQRLGIQVTRVPTYTTCCVDKEIYAVELELLRQGMIDVIAFSSTAEVESFLTMLESNSDYQHCIVACFGPYTATNAQKLGVNVSIVSNNYSSFAGFANAIAQFFHQYE